MNALNNIKHNRKVISNEIRNKLVDKAHGNSILTHLDDLETTIRKGEGKKNKRIQIEDLIKGGGGGGGGEGGEGGEVWGGRGWGGEDLRLNWKFASMVVSSIKPDLELVERNITPDFGAKMITSYIQGLGDFTCRQGNSTDISFDEFGKSVDSFNKTAAYLYYPTDLRYDTDTTVPLSNYTNSQILEMFANIGNIASNIQASVIKRVTMIVANQIKFDKTMAIIATFFESEQSQHMLAYLTNHYTLIGIKFGLGVLAFAGAAKVMITISKIISHSYNQNEKLSKSESDTGKQLQPQLPIIVLPPSVKDDDIEIEIDTKPNSRSRSAKRKTIKIN